MVPQHASASIQQDAVSLSDTAPELPPAPSGDYELDLTPDQVGTLVDRRYGGLFTSLHLSLDRVAHLRALLVERQQASVDAANSALLTGLNPIRDLTTISRAIALAHTEVDSAIREELGSPILAAVSEHDRTLTAQNSVRDLAHLLADTREPLRPEQEKQMIKILAEGVMADSPSNIDRAIFGGIDARAAITDQAVTATAKVLTAQQQQGLRELQRLLASESAPH